MGHSCWEPPLWFLWLLGHHSTHTLQYLTMTFVCLQHHQGWPLPLTTTQIAFISPAGSTYTNLKIKLDHLKTAVSARSAFSVRGSRTTNAEVHDITFSCCCGSWNIFSSNLHQELVLSYLFVICLLCLLLFQCLSAHCCSWMDFQPPYLDQWTTFLGFIATYSTNTCSYPRA